MIEIVQVLRRIAESLEKIAKALTKDNKKKESEEK